MARGPMEPPLKKGKTEAAPTANILVQFQSDTGETVGAPAKLGGRPASRPRTVQRPGSAGPLKHSCVWAALSHLCQVLPTQRFTWLRLTRGPCVWAALSQLSRVLPV